MNFAVPVRDISGGDSVSVRIESHEHGIDIVPDGYGVKNIPPGEGAPVYIEVVNGIVRVLVWADINSEDPTHTIELGGAREENRNSDEEVEM